MSYPVVVYSLFLLLAFPRLYKLKREKVLYEGLLLTWVFAYGIRDHFELPTFLYNLGFELFNITFMIITLAKKDASKLRAPSLSIFFVFFVINLFSIIFNNNEWMDAIMAVRYFLATYIFYFSLSNRRYNESQLRSMNNYLLFIFIFQILASVCKLYLIGFMEGVVGTVNLRGATTATIIPLVGISFALMFYILYKRDWRLLLFSAGMLFIGLASMKRGVFMYLLFLLPVMFYYLNRYSNKTYVFQKISFRSKLMLMGVLAGLFVLGVKYNPLANPEGKRGGSFDAGYLVKSTLEYSNYNEGEYSFGRMANFQTIVGHMMNADPLHATLGYGPATLQGFKRGDGAWEQFGVQGPTTGATYQLVQCGILGTICTFLLFLSYTRGLKGLIRATTDPYWKAFGLGVLLYFAIFLFDFFTYSNCFLSTYAISFTFVYGVAVIRQYGHIQLVKNASARKTFS